MAASNEAWIQTTREWLMLSGPAIASEHIVRAIEGASQDDVECLLEVLEAEFEGLSSGPTRLRVVMQAIASRVHSFVAHNEPVDEPAFAPAILKSLYDRLLEVDVKAAAHALQVLAAQSDEESIESLAVILVESPPDDWQAAALALSPLWNAEPEKLALFFELLEEGFLQPSTMTLLLDLAGYSMRKGKLSQHPWLARQAELSSLLASVARRLRMLEADPASFGGSVEEVQRMLHDSVALTVSICDALGLIGDPAAENSLTGALDLSHRRIQVEAAGALARLGFEKGRQRLIALASDPVARCRVVKYAEELDFSDAIDESLRYPHALAESELVAWLAHAERYGIPPSETELIDSRTMYWPSYEAPCDCYLFRYTYRWPTGQTSNIGIAGPLVHAFNADLTDLPIDDIYAAFAGWQAEHEDIFEIPIALLNMAQRREADRLIEYLSAQQLLLQEPLALTFFLGEIALLAIAESGQQKLCVITDGAEQIGFPMNDSPTSLTPELLLAVFRGRKLLRTFNAGT